MEHIDLATLTPFVRAILAQSVSDDCAGEIVETEGFMERVRIEIEVTSAWSDEGYFGADDVVMAIGRVILEDFRILERIREKERKAERRKK